MEDLRIRIITPVAFTILAACGISTSVPPEVPGEPDLPPPSAQWMVGWSAANFGGGTGPSATTVRNMALMSVGGSAVRIRLSNAFSDQALTIGEAWVGIQDSGAALVPGSNRQVLFNGQPGVTVPGGTDYLYSDPVALDVQAQQTVAVSVFVPDAVNPGNVLAVSKVLSYAQPDGGGNTAAQESGDGYAQRNDELQLGTVHWTSAVDILTDQANGAVMALGDSITEGCGSAQPPCSFGRWADLLTVRFNGLPAGQQKALGNSGIGGNQVLTDGTGPSALNRLDRDVLTQTCVTHVIFLEGINDLSPGGTGATAEEVIAGHQQIIDRVHARGIKIIGGVLTPAPYDDTAARTVINDWIRNSGEYDGIIDFDAAVRDPVNPEFWAPGTSFDQLHPAAIGTQLMSDEINLDLFDGRATAAPCPQA